MLSVYFDLANHGKYCNGELKLINGEIHIFENGRVSSVLSLANAEELIQRTYSGCGTLELKRKKGKPDESDSVYICRFTMACADAMGEFCKAVNHFIETGEIESIDASAVRVCKHCGRHLPKNVDVCLFCVKKTTLFTRTLDLLRGYKKTLLLASILLTLSTALSALLPVFNARLVDNYFSNETLPQDQLIRGILLTVGCICITQVSGNILHMLSLRVSNRFSTSFSAMLRDRVYDKIQRLSLTSISKKTAGDLMKRVTKDTETVKRFISEQGLYALEKLIMFIVILVILLRINPILTFLAIIPIPFIVYAIRRFWKTIRYRYEKQWRSESRGNSLLHDIVRGIRVVKTFGNEDREIQKFDNISKQLCKVSKRNEHLWALIFPFLSFFMGIGEYFILYFGGKAVLLESITAGQLLEFTLFLAYLYQPLRWMSSLPRRLGELSTSLIKLFEILDEKEDVPANRANDSRDVTLKGDLEFKGVSFGYRAYEPVLREINLKIRQGEMIGLVGHSGAGKSTLINLILRLYEPDRGTISIGDVEISALAPEKYREQIGVVFQETFLFAGSVYDNIAYAKPGAAPEEIIAAAKTANAHGFIMKLPDGYNTVVGENGHNLSGGERQRISIARAILRNPSILILDEATSALDPETETAIQEALGRLIKGRTTIAIAHRLATLRHANRLVVIEKGRIAETGSHRELILQNGIYAKLVMAQRQTAKLSNE